MRKKYWILVGIIIGVILISRRGLGMNRNVIGIMAQAIKQFEGWGPGSRSFRNNNPGNIRWFMPQFPKWMRGAVGVDDSGHVIFATYDDGMDALEYLLTMAFYNNSTIYNNEMTIYQFFSHYAEANTYNYADFVAKKLGVTTDTRLKDIK